MGPTRQDAKPKTQIFFVAQISYLVSMTHQQKDPYHSPDGQKWPRWLLLGGLSASAGLGIHAFLVAFLGEEARILDWQVIIVGFFAMGLGCTLLSELMRHHKDWTQQTRRNDVMRRAFLWALLTPMSFAGSIPVPVGVMGMMAVTQGAWLTIIFSILATGLFVWLNWLNVDLARRHYQDPFQRRIAETALWIGIIGAIILIGGPVLPELTII